MKLLEAYQILGIETLFPIPTLEALAVARRNALAQTHPDRHYGASQDVQDANKLRREQIDKAYEALTSPLSDTWGTLTLSLAKFKESDEDLASKATIEKRLKERQEILDKIFRHYLSIKVQPPSCLRKYLTFNMEFGRWETTSKINLNKIADPDIRAEALLWILVMLDSDRLFIRYNFLVNIKSLTCPQKFLLDSIKLTKAIQPFKDIDLLYSLTLKPIAMFSSNFRLQLLLALATIAVCYLLSPYLFSASLIHAGFFLLYNINKKLFDNNNIAWLLFLGKVITFCVILGPLSLFLFPLNFNHIFFIAFSVDTLGSFIISTLMTLKTLCKPLEESTVLTELSNKIASFTLFATDNFNTVTRTRCHTDITEDLPEKKPPLIIAKFVQVFEKIKSCIASIFTSNAELKPSETEIKIMKLFNPQPIYSGGLSYHAPTCDADLIDTAAIASAARPAGMKP